ncbi:MAG: GntP family permease [Planctomycetes bacterium]|jgi:GntP family gluconate:H+ symporter|nr:GntP family permease [Planctomycetota bacterium]
MWLAVLLLLSIVFIIVSTARYGLHPFLALLLAAFGYGILSDKMSLKELVEAVNGGFGDTVGRIGIVILAGAVIGTFLEKSGGARKLAERILAWVGYRNVPLAMGIIGYIVSIPVFCDSGYVILAPLAKALSRKAKASLAASAIALSLGLYATHTMVPPTPGPAGAASILQADLGLVILWGLLIALVSLAAGWLFAILVAARTPIEPGAEPEIPDVAAAASDGPSALKSLIPILLPIVLIVLKSLGDLKEYQPFGTGGWAQFVSFIGSPVVALLLGVFFAFLLPKKLTREMLSTTGWVGESVVAASIIIVVTACGGAFGEVLKKSGIADVITQQLGTGASTSTSLSIFLPFAIAAALKTAQGSSTVAMITTASVILPLLEPLGLGSATARALTVVAIGAGSMVVSHANDSYFWVVTGFSKMTVRQGYKLQTLGSLVQGCAAALAVWALSGIVL